MAAVLLQRRRLPVVLYEIAQSQMKTPHQVYHWGRQED